MAIGDDVLHGRSAEGGKPRPWRQALTDSFIKAKLSVMSLVEVDAAAERLGITRRRVQHLIASGELHAPARGVVDAESLDRLIARRAGGHTRAWSQETAWAAIAILSGADASWLGGTQQSRLRARLRDLDAPKLVERSRNRAVVTHYSAHPSAIRRVAEDVVYLDRSAQFGLAGSSTLSGYVATDRRDEVVRRHGLIRDDGGTVSLRATAMDLAVVRDVAERSAVLAALDLSESLDVRERRAGSTALTGALEQFRG